MRIEPHQMLPLPGKITISRPSGADDEGWVNVVIHDETSGLVVVDIAIGLAAFTEALLGAGRVPCEMMVNASGMIGKTLETKTEKVFVPDGPYGDREEIAAKAIVPHEVDGWTGYAKDAANHHKSAGSAKVDGVAGQYYWVGFRRYVSSSVPRPAPQERPR